MVSPLWTACSEGDLQKAQEFLVEGSAVDIELKDANGVTPLIEAARNGHIELVKILLAKGADPNNVSNNGPADEYTSDPAIIQLLHEARANAAQNHTPSHQPQYAQPGQDQIDKGYYPPPMEGYPYYPNMNPGLPSVNEAGAYYPPQPSNGDTSPNGLGNLPPPDVARLIPCRYFPACRYGAQCMFAHPAPPVYGQALMPPHAYAPYDPMANGYMPPYYPSQPAFAPPAGPHPMSPPPGAPMMHARSPSEVMSPPPVGHFSPNGAPPPPPPGAYGPMSPHGYSHPAQGHMSMPSIPPLAPLPPLHPHAHPGPPHPHAGVYNPATSPVPPFPMPQDAPGPYSMPPPPAPYPENANGIKPEHPQAENYNGHANHRDGNNSYRRGTPRRASFSARKPPCLFFPAGRCKNGDDCRFPHVLPENGAPVPHPTFPTVRPGPPRPRGHMNGNHAHVNGNGFQNLEAKLGNLSLRDDQTQQQSSRAKNGAEVPSRSHSSDNGSRPPKFQNGKHHPNGGLNGHHNKKAPATFRHQQRVPNADEFPVLAGSITPPIRTPPMNGSVLTAAQVLQAAAPRKDSKESSTRGPSPDLVKPAAPVVNEVKPEVNGAVEAPTTPAPAPVVEQPAPVVATPKPALSFAAAAANSNHTPDASKEVSVSA